MSDDDQHIDNESESSDEPQTPDVDMGALLGDQDSGRVGESAALSSGDGDSLLSDGEVIDDSIMDERLDKEIIDSESPLDAETLEAITDDEVIVPQGDATGSCCWRFKQ